LQAGRTPLQAPRIEPRDNGDEQRFAIQDAQSQDGDANERVTDALTNWKSARQQSPKSGSTVSSVSDSFGYFEYSESSTIALIRKVSSPHIQLRYSNA